MKFNPNFADKILKNSCDVDKSLPVVATLIMRVLMKCGAVKLEHLQDKERAFIAELMSTVAQDIKLDKVGHLSKGSSKKVVKKVVRKLSKDYSKPQLSATVQNKDERVGASIAYLLVTETEWIASLQAWTLFGVCMLGVVCLLVFMIML